MRTTLLNFDGKKYDLCNSFAIYSLYKDWWRTGQTCTYRGHTWKRDPLQPQKQQVKDFASEVLSQVISLLPADDSSNRKILSRTRDSIQEKYQFSSCGSILDDWPESLQRIILRVNYAFSVTLSFFINKAFTLKERISHLFLRCSKDVLQQPLSITREQEHSLSDDYNIGRIIIDVSDTYTRLTGCFWQFLRIDKLFISCSIRSQCYEFCDTNLRFRFIGCRKFSRFGDPSTEWNKFCSLVLCKHSGKVKWGTNPSLIHYEEEQERCMFKTYDLRKEQDYREFASNFFSTFIREDGIAYRSIYAQIPNYSEVIPEHLRLPSEA